MKDNSKDKDSQSLDSAGAHRPWDNPLTLAFQCLNYLRYLKDVGLSSLIPFSAPLPTPKPFKRSTPPFPQSQSQAPPKGWGESISPSPSFQPAKLKGFPTQAKGTPFATQVPQVTQANKAPHANEDTQAFLSVPSTEAKNTAAGTPFLKNPWMQLKAPPKDALKGDQKALGNSSQGTLGTKTPMGEGDFLDVFNLPVKKPSAKKPPPLAHSPFRKGPSFDTSTRLFEKEKPEDTQNGKGEEKLSEIEAATDLSTLEKFVSSCKLCPLCESRKGQFFGRGKLGAKILFVSDPPSLISVKSNAYPGGEQGDLLSKIIQGGLLLNEEDLYITPIVKCEIGAPDLINDLTLKICTKITLKEISIVSPTIVLALGQLAAQSLSGLPDPMDILRNKHKEYLSIGTQKIPLAMGFSLNYMLQEKDNKKRFFNDLQKIKKRLEQIIEEPK